MSGLIREHYYVGENGIEVRETRLDQRKAEVYAVEDVEFPAGVGWVAKGGEPIFVGPPRDRPQDRPKVQERPAEVRTTHLREAGHVLFGSKFFFWNLLALTEVALLRKMVGPHLPLVCHVKVRPSSVEQEAIRRMGFDLGSLRAIKIPYSLRVDRFWAARVPMYWSQTGMLVCPEAFEAFRPALGIGAVSADARRWGVYITRRDATWRAILNDAEVTEILAAHAVVPVEMRNLGLTDRIELLSTAQVIVGPIGSNMINIMLAPAGSWIIEFVPKMFETLSPTTIQIKYYAGCCGLNYVQVPVELEERQNIRMHHWNMRVPIERLRVALQFVADRL